MTIFMQDQRIFYNNKLQLCKKINILAWNALTFKKKQVRI
jgi:hypothetical protein